MPCDDPSDGEVGREGDVSSSIGTGLVTDQYQDNYYHSAQSEYDPNT